MDVFLFTAKEAFLSGTECRYNYITSYRNYTVPHTHEFYEFFIITEGKVLHNVNNNRKVLNDGSLVFIRPSDIHFYEKHQDFDCKWINITFSKKVFQDLKIYLGEDFPWSVLLDPAAPPGLLLSKTEKKLLIEQLDELNLLPVSGNRILKAKFRALLVNMFISYFNLNDTEKNNQIPSWLKDFCDLMQKRENFITGLSAMKNLSGKTHEHLCRLFRQYFSCTPTEYINSLKLNYAANLLVNSDISILNISLESGFENLSHFYHMFKKEYGTSPSKYRKSNQQKLYI